MEENGERGNLARGWGRKRGRGTGRRNLQLGMGRHGILTT